MSCQSAPGWNSQCLPGTPRTPRWTEMGIRARSSCYWSTQDYPKSAIFFLFSIGDNGKQDK
ncbi:unnamed protein product [Staurois parvus]|uniref:Uncharacterized protein n=1 Tax=Staurois parvus TaxID=386267 RepID=A0ABN9BVW7_9NEOB|nr:unnamed protein product [Staurois parvus]